MCVVALLLLYVILLFLHVVPIGYFDKCLEIVSTPVAVMMSIAVFLLFLFVVET